MNKENTQLIFDKNIDEQSLYEQYPQVLSILLTDRTTKRNIVWATDDYKNYGELHQAKSEITTSSITGRYAGIIAPRVAKSRSLQTARTKGKAEVFTPSWICNKQNNLVDEAWFGRENVFNQSDDKSWTSTTEKITFSNKRSKSWMAYVDDRRLEITCGEAPYLVSRYDTTTSDFIPLIDRIGILDRKLRIVNENSQDETEWLKWSKRAFEATYGFEYQGDSLFLARENLLATYVDYTADFLQRNPTEEELVNIATIISWNIWQMDGLTGYPPYSESSSNAVQLTLFDFTNLEDNQPFTSTVPSEAISLPCRVKDWRANKIVIFNDLISKSKDDK